MLLLHRWLGLTAGLVFAIAAGTGAILVYADELDALLAGPRFETTPGVIPADQIERALARQVPGTEVVRVIWPSPNVNTLGVRVLDGGKSRDLVIDAGSGQVITPRPQHPLLVLTRRLHAGLLIGPTGGLIVLAASAATLVSLVLGVILWWPGIRRTFVGLRLRLGRGFYLASFDLHQVLGILAVPLLVVMTATGLLIDPSIQRALAGVLDGPGAVREWATARAMTSPESGARLGLASAVRIAQAVTDGAIHHVAFPARPDGIIEVRSRSANGAHRLALDPRSGAVILHQRIRYAPETNARLHFGQIGGPIVRTLYSAACLIGFSLLPTGVAVWWLKRRRSQSSLATRTVRVPSVKTRLISRGLS